MTDLVSGLNISLFPSIGLVIFGFVFTLVLARTLLMSRRQAGHAASLPLDDAPVSPSKSPAVFPHTATDATARQEVNRG